MRTLMEIREFLEKKQLSKEIGRNNFVFRFACLARDEGHSYEDTIAYAQVTFEESDFETYEIRKTVNSAFRVKRARSDPKRNENNQLKAGDKTFDYDEKPMVENDLAYWSQYGISEEVLKKYDVICLNSYRFSEATIYSTPGDPIFAYRIKSKNSLKIYRPFNPKYKFRWLGTKPVNFLFGYDQLPETGELVIITSGEKDSLSLISKGFNAFSLNSETATLKKELIEELKRRFSLIVILYDNDVVGSEKSAELSRKFKIPRVILPDMNNGKDISDFIFKGYNSEDLLKLIAEAQIVEKAEGEEIEFVERKDEEEKIIYTAIELLEFSNQEPQYLLKPILPRVGTGVLAGKPDIGKSQIGRQLTICVALGKKEFIGLELHLRHDKAIYIATEDGIEAMSYLLSQQLKGLREEANENLKFLFADTLEQDELVNTLDQMLTESPVDLIVIDSFGDIFVGKDNNNNMAMRATVKIFDRIAQKHQCFILFVHHINKNAYYLKPGQQHIQGGAGLVQKVRSALQLSEGEYDIRYLTVVKGNYCPREFKSTALELKFSEVNFLFTFTGNRIPVDDLGDQAISTKEKKEGEKEDLDQIAREIFGNQVLPYTKFVEEYCNKTGKKEATGKRKVTKLKELNIIEECEGGYRLKENNPIINIQPEVNQEVDDDPTNF